MIYKRLKRDLVCILDELRQLLGHVDLVASHVVQQCLRSHDINDFHQLVIVVLSLEESVHFKHEASEGAADCPHVEGVIVLLVLDEELGALVVARCDTHIIFLLGLVEICEAPVDQAQVAVFVVDHDVERLDVTVHDTVQVRVL